MKIRTDFVTNSSSSSFIVAYKTPDNIEEDIIKRYPFIKHYQKLIDFIIDADSNFDTDAGVLFKTREHWDEYIVENYSWGDKTTLDAILNDSDWLKKVYDDVVKYLANGYAVFRKYVGYTDESLSELIDDLARDNDDFIIIDCD